MYSLFVGRKGKEEFMQTLEEKVEGKRPSIDISEICEQFYNRPEHDGKPVDALVQVFKKSIQQKAGECLKEAERNRANLPSPLKKKNANNDFFNLTKGEEKLISSKDTKKFNGESSKNMRASLIDPMKTFTLDKYTLKQIQEAYSGYVTIEK